MAKYVSGRQKNLKVGISSYSENLTSLEVIGNVGIATTNATSKLYVVGDGYFTGIVTASNFSVGNSLVGAAGSFSQLNVSGITTFINGPVLVGTATSTGTVGQVLQVSGINSSVYIGGNLGIGTTNPTSKLYVVGNVLIVGITTLGITSATNLTSQTLNVSGISTLQSTTLIGGGTSTGTARQVLQVSGINSSVYIGGNLGIGQTNPLGPLQVGATTSIFIVTGVGSIGVGTTNPTRRVHIFGDASTNQFNAALSIMNTNTTGYGAYLGLNATSITSGRDYRIVNNGTLDTAGIGKFSIYDATAARDRLVIDSSGNTGIGTTNPVATLQVKDALAFETTNTTTSSTSQVAVDTFATATFRSAKYQVQITCPGQLATLGGITTGGSGYTAGTFNVTFSNSSGTGAAAQGTLTISNGTVAQIGLGTTGGSGYLAGDVLTASGGSGLQVSVASTASPSGAILTLGAITSAGIGYTAGVGVGTTTLTFLGGTGTGAVGLATIYDGVITSATLLQQPTTGTGGTVYYSGSNYTTSSVLTIAKSDVTNTITGISTDVGISTFTSLTAHGIGVSDTVRVSSTSNGLTAGTDYYVVTVPSTTTFTLGTSVGIGTTFTYGTSLSIGFYRNSAIAGAGIAYSNAITGVSTNYQVSDLLVLQNGTTADFVEYAGIANNDILGTFAADISGANTRLLLTPTYATNTVKVARQVMTV